MVHPDVPAAGVQGQQVVAAHVDGAGADEREVAQDDVLTGGEIEQAGAAVLLGGVAVPVDDGLADVLFALFRDAGAVAQQTAAALVGHRFHPDGIQQLVDFGRDLELRADARAVHAQQGLAAQAAEGHAAGDDEIAAGAVEHDHVVVLHRLDHVFAHVEAVALQHDGAGGIAARQVITGAFGRRKGGRPAERRILGRLSGNGKRSGQKQKGKKQAYHCSASLSMKRIRVAILLI